MPIEQTLTVTVNYDVYIGATKVSAVAKTGQIPAQTYDKGTVYAITPKITANQISFSVNTVGGWETGTTITPTLQ